MLGDQDTPLAWRNPVLHKKGEGEEDISLRAGALEQTQDKGLDLGSLFGRGFQEAQ